VVSEVVGALSDEAMVFACQMVIGNKKYEIFYLII